MSPVAVRISQPIPFKIVIPPVDHSYNCLMTPIALVIETDTVNEIIEVLDGGAF